MNVKQLDHLNLTVKDFDDTVNWYGRVFGFELVEEDVRNGVRWGVIKSGDAMLCIYEHPEHAFVTNDDRDNRRMHGINHFGLRIVDRQTWLETVEREHLEIHYGGAVHWPNSESWYIEDPTGYEIEVALWQDDVIRFAPVQTT